MELNDKDIKKLLVIFMILVLGVLVFFLIKPVIFSIIGGLLLAYIFYPIYKRILKYVKEKNTAAGIVSLIVVIIIGVLLWLTIPIIAQQVFEVFRLSQTLDVSSFIPKLFPQASPDFIAQTTIAFNSFASNIASGILSFLSSFILNLPHLLLQALLVAFVFFFALRDGDQLRVFVSEISPLSKSQNNFFVKKFKEITDSIVYGQVIIGLAQGIVAGVGLIIFGVPKALFLTLLAVILSIIPMIGPGLVWIPIAIYFISTGSIFVGISFLVYNLVLTSTIDNILRPYIVARRSKLSPVVVLIGMIGGIFIFGVLGLILGPLILAYLITILKAYREKTLSTLFQE